MPAMFTSLDGKRGGTLCNQALKCTIQPPSMVNIQPALINRSGGLYGGILTEVVSTDRTATKRVMFPNFLNLEVKVSYL